MQLKHLPRFILALVLGQFLFACSTAEYYRFSAVKPEAYSKSIAKAETATVGGVSGPTESLSAPAETEPTAITVESTLEASTAAPKPVLFEKKVSALAVAPVPGTPELKVEKAALESARENFNALSNAEKKDLKREMKKDLQQSDVSLGLKLLLSILLPPLAVYLHEGIGGRFWISILLTLLFWIPGVVFALLVVTDSI